MKLGIMQPYFFPYLGYFSLIKHTDRFILLDTVQFIRHGWIERNRVLKQNDGWLYIQVPIIKKKGRETLIKDLLIDNNQKWKQKIFSQLHQYKKNAPNYNIVIKLLDDLFENEFTNIIALNKTSLEIVCDYLGIRNDIRVFSEMNLSIEKPNAPDEWALNICNAVGNVDEYWNPLGGQSFFDKNKYISSGLGLKFQDIKLQSYYQNREEFEFGLSIIDVMMFNTPEVISEMLNQYELI
jgi:hypothetical protein